MLFVLAPLLPAVGGILVSVLKMEDRARHVYYLLLLAVTDVLALSAAFLGGAGGTVTLLHFSEKVTLAFGMDTVGKVFLLAVCALYTAAVIYSFQYMQMEDRENVFFAFTFVSMGAMIAVCEAANLATVYFAFETATLSTVPMVLHDRTKAAVAAGMKYLFYSMGGALLGLLGVFFVYAYAGDSAAFAPGGFLDMAKAAGHENLLRGVILAAIIGFGTKAGMYPMHGWLPAAHPIAPAPASALLSGIIAKAGIIAVIRLVFFSVGADFIRGTFVQYTWLTLALLTVFMGSMMAFREKVTKKRLAYSTVSQISYIMVGLAFLSPDGIVGALLHVLQHVASKGTLFLAAGVFIFKLHSHHVDELKGIGKKMPITMWCFMFAALSLVGIPPFGGFTSKWYLASAAIESGLSVYGILAPVVLLISALLTAGYLFPIVIDAFFPGKEEAEPERKAGKRGRQPEKEEAASLEPSPLMWGPLIALSILALLVGVFGRGIADALAAELTQLF
ncbi:MAG: proton-conducting membrane transporter [Lachnospiraceae bacterium]|nr:proton-conducting membrane transporter [Lachnospiraceae bacterium]